MSYGLNRDADSCSARSRLRWIGHRSWCAALLLAALVVGGCGSTGSVTGVPDESVRQIPDGSTVVVVKSVQLPGDLYQTLEEMLTSRGFSLREASRSGRSIRTEFKPMNGGFALRISGEVRDLGGVSVVRLSGKYRTTSRMARQQRTGAEFDMGDDRRGRRSQQQQEAQDAEWGGGIERDAFAELLRIAHELPHETLSYEQ